MRAQTQDLQLRLTLLASCMSVNYSAEQKYIQNLFFFNPCLMNRESCVHGQAVNRSQ